MPMTNGTVLGKLPTKIGVKAIIALLLIGCNPTRDNQDKSATARDHAIGPSSRHATSPSTKGDAIPIFALHGLGDSPDGFSAAFSDVPFFHQMHFLQASHSVWGGYSWFKDSIPLATTPPEQLALEVTSAARLLCRQIAQLADEPAIVTGYSQGGVMTFAATITCPERIKCGIPIAGMLPAPLFAQMSDKSSSPRVRALHGTDDVQVPYQLGMATIDAMKRADIDATMTSFSGTGHTISTQMLHRWQKEIETCLYGVSN